MCDELKKFCKGQAPDKKDSRPVKLYLEYDELKLFRLLAVGIPETNI